MVLSLTRLRLKSIFLLRTFFRTSGQCITQAAQDPNCVAGATYLGPGLTFWTATVWKSEEAAKAYVRTGPHLKSLPYLAQWCSEAATGHRLGDTVPDRKQIMEWLMAAPKFFQVKTPSANHSAGRISRRAPWLIQKFK